MDSCANVERGAEVLDAIAPDWPLVIDLASLEMESCDRCVVGQLRHRAAALVGREGIYGSPTIFDHALMDATGGLYVETYGFDEPGGTEEDWAELRRLWIEQIKHRLDNGINLV